MKHSARILSVLLVLSLLLSGSGSVSASKGTLDTTTAVAGASVSLRNFYETNENAAERLIAALKRMQEKKKRVKTKRPTRTNLPRRQRQSTVS